LNNERNLSADEEACVFKKGSKSLRYEITAALMLKGLLLFLLWFLFFSHPVKGELTDAKMRNHFLGPTPILIKNEAI
jgi:hypothetical protein